MIKTILLLVLLFPTPVMAINHITEQMCVEVAEAITEAMEDGYIKEQAGREIIDRCFDSL